MKRLKTLIESFDGPYKVIPYKKWKVNIYQTHGQWYATVPGAGPNFAGGTKKYNDMDDLVADVKKQLDSQVKESSISHLGRIIEIANSQVNPDDVTTGGNPYSSLNQAIAGAKKIMATVYGKKSVVNDMVPVVVKDYKGFHFRFEKEGTEIGDRVKNGEGQDQQVVWTDED